MVYRTFAILNTNNISKISTLPIFLFNFFRDVEETTGINNSSYSKYMGYLTVICLIIFGLSVLFICCVFFLLYLFIR